MEKISIIVPVYNVEEFIGDCIESILNQDYENIELLLVNDGSKDKSGCICDEYAKRDNRVKVIHQKNGGVSSARNTGLDNATGEYIAFVDSDDYVKKDIYTVLLQKLKEEEADMVVCNYCKVTNQKAWLRDDIYVRDECVSGREALEWLNEKHFWSYVVVWSKLYKREVFDGVRFKVNRLQEDEFIIHHLFLNAKKVAGISNVLYCYRQNANSITSLKGVDYMDGVEALYDRFCTYEEKGIREQLPKVVRAAKNELQMIGKSSKSMERDAKRENDNFAMYCDMVKRLGKEADFSCRLVSKNPRAYCKLKHLLGRG